MNEEAKLREALKDCLDAMQGAFHPNKQNIYIMEENFQALEDRYRSLVEAKEIKS